MSDNVLLYQQQIGCNIKALAEEVQRIASAVVKNPLVTFRVKDPKTLRRKMELKGVSSVFSIDDVYGIRVIVKSVEEAYRVLTEVSRVSIGYLDHDYFKAPRAVPSVNGKTLRLLQFVAYKNGVPFEIQITTIAFHEVNESLHDGYHRRRYNQ